KAAVSFGRLYKARAISDKEMQQTIISHLKTIISDLNDWTRLQSTFSIGYLAENEDNYNEILKSFDPITIIQDLSLPIIGNEEERKQIQYQKNLDCVLLQLIFDKTGDDINLMKRLTDAGIIEALLYLFETQDLNMISSASVKILGKIQSSAKELIGKLKREKKYFPNILRLFRSSDLEVLNEIYCLINHDIAVGADQAQGNSPNPLLEEISECGGIETLFDLFQRNLNQKSRDDAADLLAMLFINQEFPNALMRKEIIQHFINPLINANSDEQKIDIWNLKQIAKVVGIQYIIEL
ncbi:MAG: hypothetical protein EZS28_045442, partial [Streblomastix strix]